MISLSLLRRYHSLLVQLQIWQQWKNKKYKYDDNKIYKIVQSRIRNIFKFAEAQKHSTLIVGAWGCGVFGLSAERVAKAYKTVLQENHFGGHLVFQ